MTTELYRIHRPKKFLDMVGQDRAVKTLEGLLKSGKIPHALLFTGPSGCGKTTAARILAKKLGCGKLDLQEINAAESRGIDTIREIQNRMGLSPIDGVCRIWIIDEAHKLTGDAQTALLKMLEDPPNHVWFILATTDPQKLIKTIHTRSTEIRFSAIQETDLRGLVHSTLNHEGVTHYTDVSVNKLVATADGSARKVLVLLQQTMGFPTEAEQLEAIEKADSRKQTIDLCRAMIRGDGWKEIKGIIEQLDEEPENIRRGILGYAASVVLNGGGSGVSRAMEILEVFRDHWYDCGRAGLIMSCYSIFNGK